VSWPEPDVTVVVMAYNEPETLSPVVDELAGALERLGRPWEMIIVDDGSTDATGATADRIAAGRAGVRVVRHPVNLGLGGVYRTGFASARGRYVTFFPADGQFPASILSDFRGAMEPVDMILGLLPDRKGTPLSALLSRLERILYRVLLGPMPAFQGILMFRRALLEGVPLRSTGRGWAVLMEFILRVSRSNARIIHRATPIRPRIAGKSKVNNLRTILANLGQVLTLRRLLSQ
jgi:glycosyltransferase involved in cell wall biosynthesis